MPRKGTSIKALYGEALRSPSYRELFKQSDDSENEGNTSLKPEVLKMGEISISHYLTCDHRLDVALFQGRVSDFIKTVGAGNYSNLKHRDFKGIEVGLRGRIPSVDLQYFANGTSLWVKEEDGKDIGILPEQMFNIGVTYDGLKYVSISPYLRYVGRRNRPSDYQSDVDAGKQKDLLGGYPVFNIAVRTKKTFHPFEIVFVMQNVFNEKYYTVTEKSYKYDVEKMGRTFFVNFIYRF